MLFATIAASTIYQCHMTSGEQSRWMLGPGEVRWNYRNGWSDSRHGPIDRCYVNEHEIFFGESGVHPGSSDAWNVMYTPDNGK